MSSKKHIFVAFPNSLSGEPYHVELLSAILGHAAHKQWETTVWTAPPNARGAYEGADMQEFLEQAALNPRYTGGLMLPTIERSSVDEFLELLDEFCDREPPLSPILPLVMMDTFPDEALLDDDGLLPAGVGYVGYDNAEGGALAATQMHTRLSGRGLSRGQVLVLHGESQHDRHGAFVSKLGELMPGIECKLLCCSWNRNIAKNTVEKLGADGLKPVVGIFGASDEMAIGALLALHSISRGEAGRYVILGYDASPAAKALIDAGTALEATIVHSPAAIAKSAVDMLGKMMRDVERGAANKLETRLIYRRPNLSPSELSVYTSADTSDREALEILVVSSGMQGNKAMAEEYQVIANACRSRRFKYPPVFRTATSSREFSKAIKEDKFHIIHFSTRARLKADAGIEFSEHDKMSAEHLNRLIANEIEERMLRYIVVTGLDTSALRTTVHPSVHLVYVHPRGQEDDEHQLDYDELDEQTQAEIETELCTILEDLYNCLETSYRFVNADLMPLESDHLELRFRPKKTAGG